MRLLVLEMIHSRQESEGERNPISFKPSMDFNALAKMQASSVTSATGSGRVNAFNFFLLSSGQLLQ